MKFLEVRREVGEFDFHANESYIREQKFITRGSLPYHIDAKKKARELRRNMTESEKYIWMMYLRKCPFNVYKQKPIGHFIADFYIPSCKLVLEIDGEIHRDLEHVEYDQRRDDLLSVYGLMVLRVTNESIEQHFECVVSELDEVITYARNCKIKLDTK